MTPRRYAVGQETHEKMLKDWSDGSEGSSPWFTSIYDSSSRGSDPLCWPLTVLHACGTQIHTTCRQNTNTQQHF